MNSYICNTSFDRNASEHRYLEAIQCPNQMDDLLNAVTGAMAEHDYPQQDVLAVRLLLEEAILNAIKHGHRGDISKLVCVCCNVSDHEVTASVQDEGPGFDPAAVPDPCDAANLEKPSGRGLLIMKHYATGLFHNVRGNGVSFYRRRSKTSPPASFLRLHGAATQQQTNEAPLSELLCVA
jgi:serine/threonine-protein kinase RsbW